jgi:alkanesulfonate monooxygenase SsuD/methylene tetrahydromethanopterin reductase-like flavin-dependent oxidoreductase (luciferase family)
MKRIGFLSFGHWRDIPGSRVRTARDSLLQAIELAAAAEEVGIDGAFFRVHHFAEQQASPFPLLAAISARTSRIEIGTGVIDMRYENPLYMAEEAAAVDLISGGRLQLGVSRGSPETVLAGYEAFGHVPLDGESHAEMARRHTSRFREAISGAGIGRADPRAGGATGLVPVQPLSPTLPERIWWGAGSRASARWAGQEGMNLMSSTLLTEDTGVPFDQLQAEQIAGYREAWVEAGHPRTPRVSVSRSIIPLIDEESRRYFSLRAQADAHDQVGYLHGGLARFGRSYIGEPGQLVEELSRDAAVAMAGLLESISRELRPALGWD